MYMEAIREDRHAPVRGAHMIMMTTLVTITDHNLLVCQSVNKAALLALVRLGSFRCHDGLFCCD